MEMQNTYTHTYTHIHPYIPTYIHTYVYIHTQIKPIDQHIIEDIKYEWPYFTLAREIYFHSARTWLGEIQVVALHGTFVFLPSFLLYFFCLTYYYIRGAERGIADLFPGSGNGVTQVCVCIYIYI